jgi:hypothetical protein
MKRMTISNNQARAIIPDPQLRIGNDEGKSSP